MKADLRSSRRQSERTANGQLWEYLRNFLLLTRSSTDSVEQPARQEAEVLRTSPPRRAEPCAVSAKADLRLRSLATWREHIMKNSSDRILTPHTGSLPRSRALSAMLIKREQRKSYDAKALQAEIERNLDLVVHRQHECGVDIGNYGETPRVGFSTYTTERM